MLRTKLPIVTPHFRLRNIHTEQTDKQAHASINAKGDSSLYIQLIVIVIILIQF